MKSKKVCGVLITLCIICAPVIGNCQDGLSRPPRHAIKFSPLHLVNPEVASFQISYEYRFSRDFSVQVEGGYVFGDVWWTYHNSDVTGYKLKQEFRWFFEKKEIITRSVKTAHKGIYLAAEFHQNQMEFLKDPPHHYRQNGIGFKTGFVRHSTWGFTIDLNFGIALARANSDPLGIQFTSNEDYDGRLFSLPIVGLRLGLWIK